MDVWNAERDVYRINQTNKGLAQRMRELLLTLRALIDWYLDRLDKPELTPQVEDIPIE